MQKLADNVSGEAGLHKFKFIVANEVKGNAYVKVWNKSDGCLQE